MGRHVLVVVLVFSLLRSGRLAEVGECGLSLAFWACGMVALIVRDRVIARERGQ